MAYRGDEGELHVLQAHCPHLGAHIGHGGKVLGDCVTCPYHGWEWGPDGVNVSIPYQDKPNRSKRLRVWPVNEQYGSVYLWHHPHGEPPSWPMPDIFLSFPQFETDPAAYYEPITAKAVTRAGAPPGRRRERPRQRALPLRAPRDGLAGRARLEPRRTDLEVPDRLAQRPQRRPERDGAADPQLDGRPRRLDHRLRGRPAAPADVHLHTDRARRERPLLHGVVAAAAGRRLAHAAPGPAGADRQGVPLHDGGRPGDLALPALRREPGAREAGRQALQGPADLVASSSTTSRPTGTSGRPSRDRLAVARTACADFRASRRLVARALRAAASRRRRHQR